MAAALDLICREAKINKGRLPFVVEYNRDITIIGDKQMARHYRKYTDKQVGEAIKTSFSWRETAFKLGLNGDGGSNNKTLKKIASKHSFDFSHFKGCGWNLGKDAVNAIPLKDLLKKNTIVATGCLKKKLLKKGILKNKCSICGQPPIWKNKPLVLELDHIDGDRLNNELSNLRIICGHCHSQTPTFRGRKLKTKKNKTQKILKPKKKKNNKTLKCKICNSPTHKSSKHIMCRKCYLLRPTNSKVKNRPTTTQLLKEIKDLGYTGTGRKYNVSDNCIRKWSNKTPE